MDYLLIEHLHLAFEEVGHQGFLCSFSFESCRSDTVSEKRQIYWLFRDSSSHLHVLFQEGLGEAIDVGSNSIRDREEGSSRLLGSRRADY